MIFAVTVPTLILKQPVGYHRHLYNDPCDFYNNNNARFVERRGAIASEALADRSSQLASNRREKMSFKSSFK